MTQTARFEGRRILVIEDDFVISLDFAERLKELGVDVIGPVGNIDDALDLVAETTVIDGAVLDLNLGGEMSYPVADALAERNIPFVFTTGYDQANIAGRFSGVTRCGKPVDLTNALQALFK